ncbi:uncharacterized protein LOC117791068 [Drosophila innubila]|uniref:uncharacterized protein LOC117791068 n=1 Tax=Drosophila innubila TaxID=198719 RepID=UPI00148D2E9F|nr:uncharacterized protein LOC117791068 [Drosophila innubila]
MQRYQVCTVFVLILFRIYSNDAEWLKKYEEDYHRPTYYNKAHKSDKHVDYSHTSMESRDLTTKTPRNLLTEFDPKIYKSYYVNILNRGSVICAGALISRRMIITSSRCFLPDPKKPTEEFKAEEMSVITGNDFGPDRSKTWKVIAFFMPAPKKNGMGVHDIALLALRKKLRKVQYRYIKLYNRMPMPGAAVTMSFVDHNSHDITLYESKVLNIDSCNKTYEKFGHLHIPFDEEFFCVSNRKKAGCSTRPGDPLFIENKLAGINIYGEQCDELEGGRKADVYYAIRHTFKFIQKTTDMLRAFTGTGPFNNSATTKRTQLFQETTTIATYLIHD